MSVYWSPTGGGPSVGAAVEFRELGGNDVWRQGLDLWYDESDGEYRGSLVDLKPGAEYEIRTSLLGSGYDETTIASTWSEDFPIGEVVYLDELSETTLTIDRPGTPDGYTLYTAPPGMTATIDVDNRRSNCIRVTGSAAYVIIRGLTLHAASEDAILLDGNVHDIVIEQCDIYEFGASGDRESNAGVGSTLPVERIIIQRNKIHDPRGNASSWADGHPGGPVAVEMKDPRGNLVIRYNEFYSGADHYFKDVLGGGTNYSYNGFPGPDSDIYGNYVANCWDDGIQAEGGGVNVRIFGNYIEHTYVKIAIAPVSKGPMYIFRNIAGTSRKYHTTSNSDQYDRGPFLKAGGRSFGGTFYGRGKTYVFHNTILQPAPSPGRSQLLGSKVSVQASGGDLYNFESRNNIFVRHDGSTGNIFTDNVNSCTNSLDFDLYRGDIEDDCSSNPHERNGFELGRSELPQYDPSNLTFDRFVGAGSFALAPGAEGFDAAEFLPNFNDRYNGDGPDVGAFEFGDLYMQFGTYAYTQEGFFLATDVGKMNGPGDFVLDQNYPNPFNPSTTIEYYLRNDAQVRLDVYDILGQHVSTLVDAAQTAGPKGVIWAAHDLSAGVYYYRLTAGEQTEVKKMLLTK